MKIRNFAKDAAAFVLAQISCFAAALLQMPYLGP